MGQMYQKLNGFDMTAQSPEPEFKNIGPFTPLIRIHALGHVHT